MPKLSRSQQLQSLNQRLLSNRLIDPKTRCWEWTGKSRTKEGYGVLGSTIEGRNHTYAHRASWMIKHGTIPSQLVVCHRCDNPKCFNPDHLWLGTHIENMLDMMSKFRQNYFCNQLTPDSVQRKVEACFNTISAKMIEYGLSQEQVDSIITTIKKFE